MDETSDAADRIRGVHFAHCYSGEYRHTCKYGDDDCPASIKDVPDHPNDRTLDPEDRAMALVRYLANSTDADEMEQAKKWAQQLAQETES